MEAALVVLERMGLSPTDLTTVPHLRKPVPTFAEYVPAASAAVSNGTRQAYGSYWKRITEQWGGRRLDEPTSSDIRQLMAYVKTHVVARRNARGGRSAQEHLVPEVPPHANVERIQDLDPMILVPSRLRPARDAEWRRTTISAAPVHGRATVRRS